MSEEEILNILENYDNEDNLSKIHKAIQGLLELYKKQQKEIEELENKIAKRQWVKVKENGEVKPLFYISKDKIREKIKELEQIKSTALTNRTIEMMNDKISILNLILEEDTNE